MSKVWRIHVWQIYIDSKLEVKNSFFRSNSATHGVARLLKFYFTTRDHPLSKPHSPWPAGVGGPWNLKNHWISPNLPGALIETDSITTTVRVLQCHLYQKIGVEYSPLPMIVVVSHCYLSQSSSRISPLDLVISMTQNHVPVSHEASFDHLTRIFFRVHTLCKVSIITINHYVPIFTILRF